MSVSRSNTYRIFNCKGALVVKFKIPWYVRLINCVDENGLQDERMWKRCGGTEWIDCGNGRKIARHWDGYKKRSILIRLVITVYDLYQYSVLY